MGWKSCCKKEIVLLRSMESIYVDRYPYGGIRVLFVHRPKNAETRVREMVTCLTLFWMIQR
jgi:hypothetical protein